jgi:hypothetical protein
LACSVYDFIDTNGGRNTRVASRRSICPVFFVPFSITTDDGTERPVQSREHALIGRSHLVLLDSLRNIELINQRKITSISIKKEGWSP